MIAGLAARVHLFVRPEYRERFTHLFRNVLACELRELDFGLQYPILFIALGDGSGVSVEFRDDAPEEPRGDEVDDAHALRGAWIEFRSSNVHAVEERLRAAQVPSFTHPGSAHAYFSAPGGQVFRVLDIGYRGP
jgi:hypothetical protein